MGSAKPPASGAPPLRRRPSAGGRRLARRPTNEPRAGPATSLVVLGVAAALAADGVGWRVGEGVGGAEQAGAGGETGQAASMHSHAAACACALAGAARFLLLRHSRGLVLPLHAAGAAAAKGRGEAEVDVLLAVDAHKERGDVHHLLAHPVERRVCACACVGVYYCAGACVWSRGQNYGG